jgi:O-antigen ligase
VFLTRHLQYYRENLSEALILLLMFSLPFSRKFSSVLVILIVVSALYKLLRAKESRKRLYVHWALPLLFVFFFISSMFSTGLLSSVEKNLFLIIIPISLGIQNQFFHERLREKIFGAFILGNVVVSVICLIRATVISFQFADGKWNFIPQVSESRNYDFLTSSVMGGNHYFGEQFSVYLHPGYFGLFIVFAQYLLFELAQSNQYKTRQYLFIGTTYVFFLIILFFLSSKAAQISSLLLTSGLCVKFLLSKRWSWQFKSALILVVTAVSFLFIFFNPRLKTFKDTLSLDQFTDINPNARFGHDVRILSWDASLDVIKKNWLIGVGEGSKEDALVETYRKKGYTLPVQERFNSHNQYLDFLLSGGVIGLTIFLVVLANLIIRSLKNSNFPLLVCVLLFAFNCLFENLLSRYWGILFFATFITLLDSHFTNRQSSNRIPEDI